MPTISLGMHIIVQTPNGARGGHVSAIVDAGAGTINARVLLDGAADIPMTYATDTAPLFCQSDGWIGGIPYDGSATPAVGSWAPA